MQTALSKQSPLSASHIKPIFSLPQITPEQGSKKLDMDPLAEGSLRLFKLSQLRLAQWLLCFAHSFPGKA